MELGLGSRYVMPQMDNSYWDPGMSYGALFHYWLNTTTSVQVSYDYLDIAAPIDVLGDEREIEFTAHTIDAGVRYRFPLDFFLTPYAEAALGLQFWNMDPDAEMVDDRGGMTVRYMGGLGVEYLFMHSVTVAAGARYHYLPMREHLEREVRRTALGNFIIEDEDLTDAGYLSAGVDVTFKIK